MPRILILVPLMASLAACTTLGVGPARAPAASAADQTHAVHELLHQAADVAVNRLGRLDGFWDSPALRIPLPDEVLRVEKNLRRLGLDRQLEEFAQSLNRAAEEAMPAAKPVMLDAVQRLTLADAVAIVGGEGPAATRYFRAHTGSALESQLRPLVAVATARSGVTAAYKRLQRKAAFLNRLADPGRLDIDAHIARHALDSLYRVMAEEEQRIRRDPRARTTELLRQVFR